MRNVKIALILTVMFSASANAALVSRLGGLAYYDTEANLTWLADANYALTSGYDTNGLMNWVDANAWADGLTIGGNSNWRLATTSVPDSNCTGNASFGHNCTDGEMGNLFYNVLGGAAGSSIVATHNTNYDLFSNVQSTYWSGTEYLPIADYAWYFKMDGGDQYGGNRINSYYAWAVQSGDVAAVPVPAAMWLFASAILGLAGLKRRKT